MNWRYVALLVAGVMVAVPFISITTFISVASAPEEVLLLEKGANRPAGWWSTWSLDRNMNCIDDRLEGRNPGEVTAVYAVYDHHPSPGEVSRVRAMGYNVVYVTKYTNALCIEDIRISQVNKLALLPGVMVVEEQGRVHPLLDVSVPSIRATESSVYDEGVWEDLGITGDGVAVAIIDTGVDDEHPALQGHYLMGVDFSRTGVIVYQNPDDKDGHGTHCAGIVMSSGDDTGTPKGVAPGAKLIDLKVINNLGDTFADKIIMALEWCIENQSAYNIRVASMSLGGRYSSDGTGVEAETVNKAAESGIIPVAASGNDGQFGLIPTPAAADGAICVGATDDQNTITRDDDVIADYSNRGPRPSDNDGNPYDELKPDIVAPGTNIDSCMHSYSNQQGWGTIQMSGTSMATPHISGVCALMAEAYPDITTEAVRTILHQTAEARGQPNYPDLSAKYNFTYGYGIVDAYGAVARAKDLNGMTVDSATSVTPRETVQFTAKAHYTLTDYNLGGEDFVITAAVPDTFSRPTNIDISYDGAKEHTTSIDGPTRNNGMWEITATVSFSQGGMDDSGDVTLVFQANAPQTPGEYTSSFGLSIAGVEGRTVNRTVEVVSQQEDRPDFSVTRGGISFSPENPSSGDTVTIRARINNTGAVSGSCNVSFYDGLPSSNTEIGTTYVTVPAGSYTITSVDWTAVSGRHTIYVVADPSDDVAETNEFNNTASKVLDVGGGVNIPPVARLKASPEEAVIGEVVTFDGSSSYDLDGSVVSYFFDFGDGYDSGWVEDSVVTYTYGTDGTFVATLKVKDNVGQESSNTASVNITVKSGRPLELFLDTGGTLTQTEPTSVTPDKAECPIGNLGPIGGLLEWKEVGKWTTTDLAGRTISDSGTLRVWIANEGSGTPTVLSLRAAVVKNDNDISDVQTKALPLLRPNATTEVNITMPLSDKYEIEQGDAVGVRIEALTDAEGIYMYYNSRDYPSSLTLVSDMGGLQPPIADAGPDVTAYINENVTLEGKGTDPDGTVVKYEWDFDGDGTWDYSGMTGTVTTSYSQVGTYTAKLRVTDNDGLTDTDTTYVKVIYEGQNKPPVVTIEEPENGTNVTGLVNIKGTASDDDGDVSYVEVRIGDGGWKKAKGTTQWSYSWDTMEYENGVYLISARSYDGQDYSSVVSVEVTVDNINDPPTILSAGVSPPIVNNDGVTPVYITASVSDPNGPEDISTVYVDLSPMGLAPSQEMMDDGLNGDGTYGDGTYGTMLMIPSTVQDGIYHLTITAVDRADNNASTQVVLQVQSVNYPPEIEDVTITPNKVTKAGSVLIEVVVNDPNGLDDIKEVRADLTDIGLDSEKLYDDGTNGDKKAGDGVYSLEIYVSKGMGSGTKTISVEVADKAGESDTSQSYLVLSFIKSTSSGETAFIPGYDAIIAIIVLLGTVFISSWRRE